MLTAKQIIEEKLITKVDNPKSIQQVGIDLEVESVKAVIGVGIIPKEGKTTLPQYEDVIPEKPTGIIKELIGKEAGEGWLLKPGYYEITLKQGCALPANRTLLLKQRSSLCRSGALVHSGLYDPGFSTENIGAFIHVLNNIFIEKGARVCQGFVLTSDEVDETYKGQYQNDKQRE